MKNRIEWIDLVKATSVLLVVFMHATNVIADLGGPSWVMGAIQGFNQLVEPVRMPIFFLVSGMLASSAIRRPWRQTLNRTTGMFYLYVTWILLYTGFTVLLGASLHEPFTAILFAKSGYWYLYAMALFFIVAKLLRNQPAWLVVAVAIVPNLLRPLVDQIFGAIIPGTLFTSMTLNIAFFLAGAYFKDVVAGVAQKATVMHTVALGALSVVTGLLWMNTPSTAGQSYFLLSVVWVAFGISLAVQLTRNGAPSWAKYVGSRTLPIYVAQWPVLLLVSSFLPAVVASSVAMHLALPLLITGIVAALALFAHRIPALRFLFVAPAWTTQPRSLTMPTTWGRRLPSSEPASVATGR